jgi:hypothetical protein
VKITPASHITAGVIDKYVDRLPVRRQLSHQASNGFRIGDINLQRKSRTGQIIHLGPQYFRPTRAANDPNTRFTQQPRGS